MADQDLLRLREARRPPAAGVHHASRHLSAGHLGDSARVVAEMGVVHLPVQQIARVLVEEYEGTKAGDRMRSGHTEAVVCDPRGDRARNRRTELGRAGMVRQQCRQLAFQTISATNHNGDSLGEHQNVQPLSQMTPAVGDEVK
ncbi:hypothetical protein [Nonomuraea sp. NPDC049141]|uniref:hypothetical protein n=1 Tax=Nonomuraea sp. NPDC049141 TaxID=3155500 RepID=UPI0033DF8598